MGVFGESFTQEVVNKVRAVNRKERAVFVGQLKFTLLHNVQSFDEAILQQIPTERLLNLRIIFKTRSLKLREPSKIVSDDILDCAHVYFGFQRVRLHVLMDLKLQDIWEDWRKILRYYCLLSSKKY
eukprot:TRINITY_DN2511_c0_g1_i9.p2 TRINITY_DN2511_c0_g1~~TRINITY_DN2511_c0_g1_i9.p2  ORF type:complete len:126 (+),score=6.09 TRINITY_DN2511_c0_g1_i9:505-882(+)